MIVFTFVFRMASRGMGISKTLTLSNPLQYWKNSQIAVVQTSTHKIYKNCPVSGRLCPGDRENSRGWDGDDPEQDQDAKLQLLSDAFSTRLSHTKNDSISYL